MTMFEISFKAGKILMLVILLTVTVFAFVERVQTTGAEIKTVTEDLEIVGATHIIEECLKINKEYIDKTTLQGTGKNICNLCKLCTPHPRAELTDLITKESWNFGYTGDRDYQHSIFVQILDGDDIHIGRLNVET